jgi:NSS family neurotransmitter:Na+ symporter
LYYAVTAADFQAGVDFMFTADFSKLTFGVFISAMGHAFFTLSLAMGAIMVYGAYLPKNISIATAAVPIVIADTAVAILAGLIIFPIVFSNGLEPAAGPSLIFETLPVAFGQMPGGTFWGTIFFILLAFAAWTSAISLIEPAVAWVVEKGVSRVTSVFIVGGLTWLVGLLTVFSFNELAFEFEFAGLSKTAGFFDAIDILTSIIMLPIGGILIAIFCGWIMPRAAIKEELGLGGLIEKWWIMSVSYVAPIGVSLVMIYLIFGN